MQNKDSIYDGEASLTLLDSRSLIGRCGSKELIVGSPQSEAAGNQGFRSTELLLLCLGGCLGLTLLSYFEARKISLEGLSLHLKAFGTRTPPIRDKLIEIVADMKGNVTRDEKESILKICERGCKITNTLKMPVEIRTTLL